MKAHELIITDADFDTQTGQGVVLIDFWAPRCGPCRQQLPILEKVAATMAGQAKVGKCNVDEEPKSAERFDVRQIPTLVILKDQREIERFIGLQMEADLIAALKKHVDKKPMEDPLHDEFFGRMNDPTASASIKGVCGDVMEFYLVIRDDRIEDIRYFTNGCGNTQACGHAVARRARGRNVTDALSISAGEIIRSGECETESGRHCAILAVTTFYRALADYLLTP